MNQLFSALTGPAFEAKPILVIGGGPSALETLKRYPTNYFAAVISANGHGFKQDRFDVDYIVSVDYMFGSSGTKMQDYLRQFNRPSINRWSWADFRLPEWNFNGDSGLTAIAVAAMLGGHPVVAAGMDRYIGEKRYFWETEPDVQWARRGVDRNPNARSNVQSAVQFCEQTWVESPGPLAEHWPIRAEAKSSQQVYFKHEAPQRHLTGSRYALFEPIFLHPTDRVNTGPILLTSNEAKGYLRLKKIHLI